MDSDIGNIRAVREWSRRYFYTKQDIGFFVTKLNSGLKAYALMIIGPHNKKVTINPGNYEFTLNSDGWYRYLFFFEDNSEITLAVEDGDTITYQLDEYNDTINLSPWVIATPAMTSICRPSGYITGGPNDAGYGAFDRDDSNWYSMSSSFESSWMTYEFIEPIIIYKVKFIYTSVWGTREPQNNHIYIQGSNDNSHWTNLLDDELTDFYGYNVGIYAYEGIINDPGEYLYYRIWSDPLTNSGSLRIQDMHYYTVEQPSTVYNIATPVMSSNTEPSGIVTVSSTRSSSDFPGWKAFNQNIDTEWISWNDTNPWIQYQFPNNEPKIIKKIQLWQGCYYQGVGVINFKLEASNDGEVYNDLGTYVFRHTDKYYTQTFLINNATAYLYYKITIISATSGDFNQLGFRRIDLLEEV